MELIIDANIFMAVVISSEGKTRDLLFKDGVDLFAPEYLLKEFNKHKNYISGKSKLSHEDFLLALGLISSRVKFIPFSEFEKLISKAKIISPDPDDIEYIALALKLKCAIWSNDKELKRQKEVRVYSTSELINLLR